MIVRTGMDPGLLFAGRIGWSGFIWRMIGIGRTGLCAFLLGRVGFFSICWCGTPGFRCLCWSLYGGIRAGLFWVLIFVSFICRMYLSLFLYLEIKKRNFIIVYILFKRSHLSMLSKLIYIKHFKINFIFYEQTILIYFKTGI